MKAPFSFIQTPSGGGGPAFDPATLALTTWLRRYTGSSPWSGTASAGSSGSNDAAEHSSPPTAGTALNGKGTALFTAASFNELTTADNINTIFSMGAGTAIALVKLTTVPADAGDGAPYSVSTLTADSDDGNIGFGVSDAGVRGGFYSGGYVSKAVGGDITGAWHAVQFKWNSTEIKVRVDSGAWSTVAAGAASLTGVPGVIGRSFIGTAWLNGLLAELMTAASELSDTDCDNVLSYFDSEYGLAFDYGFPTISSLSTDTGDPAGGYDVVITGTNFGTATDVTFGGTSASSFSVDSDTQITATVPAGTSGSVDVVVVTADGTTDPSAFEYWSPGDLAPKGFWDKGGYALSGVGGAGVWTPSVYNGPGSGVMNAAGAGTSPDLDTGAMPHFVAAHSDALGLAGSNVISALLGSTAGTILGVVNVDSIAGSSTTAYSNDTICGDTFAYAGLYLGGSGSNRGIFFWYDGAVKKAEVVIGTSGRMVIGAKNVSGTLKITADGSSYTTGDTGVGALAGGNVFVMGGGAFGGLYLNARLECLVIDHVAWSDADIAKFYKWAATRHP